MAGSVRRMNAPISLSCVSTAGALTWYPVGVRSVARPPASQVACSGLSSQRLERTGCVGRSAPIRQTAAAGGPGMNKTKTMDAAQRFLRLGLAPLPATGKRAQFDEIVILQIRDGKVFRQRGIIDNLSALRQLGAVPSPRS
jgi:hypothetical protein